MLLRNLKREEVERGQVLTIPGAIAPHARGEAELFVLTEKEGGRRTPFATGYMPQFFFGATDVTGTIEVLGETGVVQPGERARIQFRLGKPIGLEAGMRFALREGNKTVGAGVVTAVT